MEYIDFVRKKASSDIFSLFKKWELPLDETNFLEIQANNFSIQSFAECVSKSVTLPDYARTTLPELLKVLTERLNPTFNYIEKITDKMKSYSKNYEYDDDFESWFTIWNNLTDMVVIDNEVSFEKISHFFYDKTFILWIDILLDRIQKASFEDPFDVYLRFFDFIDEWKNIFERFQETKEYKDQYLDIVETQAYSFVEMDQREVTNEIFSDLIKKFPNKVRCYISYFEIMFEDDDFIDYAFFENILLSAKKIALNNGSQLEIRMVLSSLIDLYDFMGNANERELCENEHDRLNSSVEEEIEGKINGLFSKHQNHTSACSGVHVHLNLICYSCYILYEDTSPFILINDYVMNEYFDELSLKPDNGDFIIPCEIICPNCSYPQFIITGETKRTLVSNLFLWIGYEIHNFKQFERILKREYPNLLPVKVNNFTYKLNPEVQTYKEAVIDIKKKVQTDPKNIDLLTRLAAVYGNSNYHSKAKKIYKTILKLDPNNPDALFHLGEIYLGRIDVTRARLCFRLMLKTKKYWKKRKSNDWINPKTIQFVDGLSVKSKRRAIKTIKHKPKKAR